MNTPPDTPPPTGTAADGSPFYSAAASSVFNWRDTPRTTNDSAPVPGAAVADQPQPEEEETMATTKKPHKARAASAGKPNPQHEICSALAAHGALTREGIAQALPHLTPQQIASALNNAKSKKRITGDAEAGYVATSVGAKWAGAEETAAAPRRKAAARKTAHRRARKPRQETTATEEVDTSPSDPTFRCGVLSDGAFFIAKDGQSIELDAAEHKVMLTYLERMAVEA